MKFINQVLTILGDILIAVLNVIKMFFKDFSSFRNRLIGYICVVGLIVILSENVSSEVQIAIFTIVGTCIGYYFKQRNDSNK